MNRTAEGDINILASGNDTYAFSSEVLLVSLLENSGKHGIQFYFLYNAFSNANRQRLEEVVKRYPGCDIHFLYVDDRMFQDVPLKTVDNSYISVETYFRLALSELLPDSLDRILYLDTDIIVNKDIDSFYRQSLGKDTAAVVCDDYGRKLLRKRRKKREQADKDLGFDAGQRYFNAGVILMNLEYIRVHLPFEVFMEFVREHNDQLLYHDQDVLNATMKGHLIYEDYNIYNCRPFYYWYSRKSERKICENAAIIHYGEKPWQASFADLAGRIFWKYAVQAGYEKQYKQWKAENNEFRSKHRMSIAVKRLKRDLKILLAQCNIKN